MATNIKGLTVEIGADTSKLEAAFRAAENSIKSTESQLRDLNKALKLDPGNTDLLADKQKALQNEIASTKDKLTQLQEAQKMMDAEEVDKNSTAYQNLQTEIDITTSKVKSLTDEYDNFGSVGAQKIAAVGEDVKSAGNKITDVGKAITPVSAAVAGVGVAGLKVAADFEQGMSQVKAISGATGEEFDQLRETAIDLGADTAYSSSEVANAMTEMAKAGWSSQQIVDGMSGVLAAAAASGEDLGNVSTIVADAITGFGMAASDSTRVADLLTQAANAGTIDVNDLGESYKYISPLANTMGLDIEGVTTALEAMSMSGIKGSQAGTSLRTMLTNIIKPSKSVSAALEELGIDITDGNGNFLSMDEIVGVLRDSFTGLTDEQKSYYASAIAGKEGQAGMLSLLNLTEEEYSALSEEMSTCGGIAEETASIMQDNLNSRIEQLGGALESLAIKLADNVLPYLTDFIEFITGIVDGFTEMDPATQKIVLVIGALVAALGPALVVIGKVVTAVGSIMTYAPTIVTGVKGIGVALGALSGPVGIVIAVIAALVAAGVALYMNWDTIKEKAAQLGTWLGEKWEDIKEGVSEAWTAVTESISQAWENITTAVSEKATAVKDAIATKWNEVKTNAGTKWEEIKTSVSEKWASIKDAITEKGELIKASATTVWEGMKTLTGTAWETIKTSVQTVWDNMKLAYEQHGGGIQGVASAYLEGLHSVYEEGYNLINELTGGKLQEIVDMFTEKFESAKEIVRGAIETIKGFFDFEWHLPDLKLPHFSISGSFSLNPPSVPSFGIDWYDKGGIFTSPSVIGVGEKRPEFVGALDDLRSIVREESGGGNGAILAQLTKMTALLAQQSGGITVNVTGADGQDVNVLADIVIDKINNQFTRTRAAFG